MRCVVVTRFYSNQPGYLDFAYRIEALARHYQVTIVSDHTLTVPELHFDNVEYVLVAGGTSTVGKLRYVFSVNRYIRSTQPDVVILLHSVLAPLIYLLNDIPHALYWNEYASRTMGGDKSSIIKKWFRELKYRFLYVEAVRRGQMIMPIGEAHRDYLLAQGCPPEHVKLIYMGVAEAFQGAALKRTRLEDDPLELIYTGTVQKARGRDVMLEAVAMAKRAGVPVRLTMVGAIPTELAYCNDYAKKLGIAENVTILGRVPGTEIPSFIAKADAGICIWEDKPWWRFNPPTKLFEYLVTGLPVLASNIRTHTEYIRHGDNGLIFEYDSNSLAGAIAELWRRRAELGAFRQRAFESGRPYLWNNIEPVFLEAVASLMRR